MLDGYRAQILNLFACFNKGVTTISGLINKWSPPDSTGNTLAGTNNYINYISSGTGIAPNKPLNSYNKQQITEFIKYQTLFENGSNSYINEADIEQAYDEAVSGIKENATAQQTQPGKKNEVFTIITIISAFIFMGALLGQFNNAIHLRSGKRRSYDK